MPSRRGYGRISTSVIWGERLTSGSGAGGGHGCVISRMLIRAPRGCGHTASGRVFSLQHPGVMVGSGGAGRASSPRPRSSAHTGCGGHRGAPLRPDRGAQRQDLAMGITRSRCHHWEPANGFRGRVGRAERRPQALRGGCRRARSARLFRRARGARNCGAPGVSAAGVRVRHAGDGITRRLQLRCITNRRGFLLGVAPPLRVSPPPVVPPPPSHPRAMGAGGRGKEGTPRFAGCTHLGGVSVVRAGWRGGGGRVSPSPCLCPPHQRGDPGAAMAVRLGGAKTGTAARCPARPCLPPACPGGRGGGCQLCCPGPKTRAEALGRGRGGM